MGSKRFKRRTGVILCIVSLQLLLICAACGRKGAPRPPEEVAPRAVQFFTVRGDTSAVVLQWSEPEENASGDRLKNLDAFYVRRAEVVNSVAKSFERIGRVDLAEALAPAPTTVPPAPHSGRTLRQFQFRDTDVQIGHTYDYTVTAVNTDDIEGETIKTLRVKFAGESTTVENATNAPKPALK
jgi:hypothetical protein